MRKTLLLAALMAAPMLAKTPLLKVPLEWKPTKTATEMGMTAINLLPFQGKTFTLEAFTEGRQDPERIGENQEKKGQVLPVTTRDQVPEWVTAQTQRFLTSLGLPMAAKSDRVLKGEVQSFFVAEGENYMGDVRLKIQVLREGKVVWSGMAMGAAKRFGRSYKLDNYQETLSDSLLEAWVSLMKNPDFLATLAQ